MITLGLEANDFLKLMTNHPQSSRQFKGYAHLNVYNLIPQVMNILILGLVNMAYKNFPTYMSFEWDNTGQQKYTWKWEKLPIVTIDFGSQQMAGVSGRWHHIGVKFNWTKQGESQALMVLLGSECRVWFYVLAWKACLLLLLFIIIIYSLITLWKTSHYWNVCPWKNHSEKSHWELMAVNSNTGASDSLLSWKTNVTPFLVY